MAEDDKASKMDKIHVLKMKWSIDQNPYFVSDAYNSSDAINHFDWAKVSDKDQYPDMFRLTNIRKASFHFVKNLMLSDFKV